MDSYREADKEWFFGREELSDKLLGKIEVQEIKALCVRGPAKVAKTSFIRTGVIPRLDTEKYDWVYLRCRREVKVEDQLRCALERRFPLSFTDKDLDTAFAEVKAKTSKRILIFFDQPILQRIAAMMNQARTVASR